MKKPGQSQTSILMGVKSATLAQLKTLRTANEWSFPLAVFVLSRVVVLVSLAFAAQYLPLAREPWTVPEKALLPLLRWDAGWYMHIAEHGYAYLPEMGKQHAAVFFPLYPMLVRGLHILTGFSPRWLAVIISNTAFLAALYSLNRVVQKEHGQEVAEKTLLYVAIFPSAVFFSTAYTESLFFFLCTQALYEMRRDRWPQASVWALLASLTRPTGIAIALAALYAFLESHRSAKVSWIRLAPVGSIAAGIGSYMVYLQIKFGDALLFVHALRAPEWRRGFNWGGIKAVPLELARVVSTDHPFFDVSRFESLSFVTFLLLSLVAFRYVPKMYAWFSLGAVLLPVPSGSLAGMMRYVLVLFPCFIVVAVIAHRRPKLHLAIVLLSVASLVCYSLLFSRWYWVG